MKKISGSHYNNCQVNEIKSRKLYSILKGLCGKSETMNSINFKDFDKRQV